MISPSFVVVVNGCFNFGIGVDSLSHRSLFISDETPSPPFLILDKVEMESERS
jgi:hypothetical protein